MHMQVKNKKLMIIQTILMQHYVVIFSHSYSAYIANYSEKFYVSLFVDLLSLSPRNEAIYII